MNAKAFLLGSALTILVVLAGCSKSERNKPAGTEKTPDTAAANEPVALKAKWPAGNRYVQRLDLVQQSEIALPNQPKPMRQDVTMGQEYALSVLKQREGGGREIEMEFLGTEMQVSMNGKTIMAFDSHGEAVGDESRNPLAATFRSLIGVRFKILVDDRGNVEKMEGLEALDKIAASAPAATRSMIKDSFSTDYLKQLVEVNKGLPDHPVHPGDSWTQQIEISLGAMGKGMLDMNYTFTGWEQRDKRRCAALSFTGVMKSSGAPAGKGMNISFDQGTLTGKSWFDPELGASVEASVDQVIKMQMQVPIGARGAAKGAGDSPTQNVANEMKQKVTIKLVELEEAGK